MFPGYLIAIMSVYTVVFCIGFVGNVWVILTLVLIRIDRKQHVTSNFKRMNHYLLALSVSDLLVLLMIPMLVTYFLNGGWKLGFITCKLFWTIENVNKLLSVAVLTIMSFERYIGICRPFNQHIKTRFKTGHLLLVTVGFILLLCSPIIYYSDTTEHVILTENATIADIKISCNSDLPDEILPYFILYMCAFGFLIPVVFISMTSIMIVRQVYQNPAGIRRHSGSNRGVLRSLSSVVIFHFACWTPFWVAVLLTLTTTAQLTQFLTISPRTLAILRLITSFFPYINSAGNWIFYAAMNRKIQNTSREVRERHERLLDGNNDASALILRALSVTRNIRSSFHR